MCKASFAGGAPLQWRVFFSRTHDAPLPWRAPSRRPTLIAVLVAFAAMICGMPAHAINIDVEQVTVPKPLPPIPFVKPKPLPPPPVPRIRLTGMIETGDAGKLEAVLTKVASAAGKRDGPLTTIELSSMGGNLIEGFGIGELLRRF